MLNAEQDLNKELGIRDTRGLFYRTVNEFDESGPGAMFLRHHDEVFLGTELYAIYIIWVAYVEEDPALRSLVGSHRFAETRTHLF